MVPAPVDTTRAPLTSWRRDVLRATVLAYRRAMGEGLTDWEAGPSVPAAFIAAGGQPELAPTQIPQMIAAAARDHGEWFWRPARERVAREERFWRSRGHWPPLMDRRTWPAIPNDTDGGFCSVVH
jgi:hypothetical protein